VREISKEERDEVLGTIGSDAISRAIFKEGMLIVGDPMTVSWRKAEIWARKKARELKISEEVLTNLTIEEINGLIIAEVDRHK